jgi:hypothetical protein
VFGDASEKLDAVVDDRNGVRGSWPAAAVCRAAPVALLAVGIVVPAVRWPSLPADRPAWLVLTTFFEAIGLLILAPQMWKPRGWAVERWDGNPVGIWAGGLVAGFLRSRFGPTGSGLFVLAFGAGLSVATTVASTHSPTWRLSFLGGAASFLAAFGIAAVGGAVVRRYGRLVDTQGRYVPRRPANGVIR